MGELLNLAFPLPLPQPDTQASAVLFYDFNAGRFKCSANFRCCALASAQFAFD
jgi:hypothetical protein